MMNHVFFKPAKQNCDSNQCGQSQGFRFVRLGADEHVVGHFRDHYGRIGSAVAIGNQCLQLLVVSASLELVVAELDHEVSEELRVGEAVDEDSGVSTEHGGTVGDAYVFRKYVNVPARPVVESVCEGHVELWLAHLNKYWVQ